MSAIQSLHDANVRSPTYYVASTDMRCGHCGLSTRLLALALPQGHETLDPDTRDGTDEGEEPVSDAWQRANVNAFLFYVERLSDPVRGRLSRMSDCLRMAHSTATLNSYWANHCEHCGTLLEDHDLHCEPDGAFMPSSEAAARGVRLVHVLEPFEAAAAGYALEPEFFRFMQRG